MFRETSNANQDSNDEELNLLQIVVHDSLDSTQEMGKCEDIEDVNSFNTLATLDEEGNVTVNLGIDPDENPEMILEGEIELFTDHLQDDKVRRFTRSQIETPSITQNLQGSSPMSRASSKAPGKKNKR